MDIPADPLADALSEAKEWIGKRMPEMAEHSYEVTSVIDFNYNCLAWALGCNSQQFIDGKGCFWPWKNISDETVDGWVQVCEIHGFRIVDSAEFERGYEKIVIFENEEGASHAARSTKTGSWKSKLGAWGPDIDHYNPQQLENYYGKVVRILRRFRSDWTEEHPGELLPS